jgi:ribose transport system substrate-binding protein
VTASVLQNPVGQAYVGAYALMRLEGGCTMKTPGEDIDSGSFVVTTANLSDYDAERQTKTKQLKAAFDSTYLSCQ